MFSARATDRRATRVPDASGLAAWWRAHWQRCVNIYLFLVFSGWAAWQARLAWLEGRFDWAEASFTLQNVIMVAMILIRRDHRAVEINPWRQAVALAAFLSGAFFMGAPATGGPAAAAAGQVIILVANVAGIVTLLNIGRSFGILIAFREVRSGGLYGIVRHPMYGTDILLRIGFVVGHCSAWTVTVFLLSSACYVQRALLEERFLSRQPEYLAYMQRVRYRFIPWVW